MANAIQDYYVLNQDNKYELMTICPAIVCADGFRMSVQASKYHYSLPRYETLLDGSYTAWEIMSDYDELLEPYNPDESIAAFVPTDVVNAIIAKHGGIKKEN